MHKGLVALALLLTGYLLPDIRFDEDSCFQQTCFKLTKACRPNNKLFVGDCKKDVFSKTFFSARPQDSNSATQVLNLLDHRKKFNFSFSYQRSFKNNDIANWFLFNEKNCVTVGVPGAGINLDVDGTQLGLSLGSNNLLPPGLKSGQIGTFCIEPQLASYIFNFDFHFDLSKLVCGAWARIGVPVVRAEANLRSSSTGLGKKTDPFNKHLFSLPEDDQCQEVEVPYDCISDAFEGNEGFGEVPALKHAKIAKAKLTETGVAGLHFNMGYDICRSWDEYLGLALNVVAPTGNRPEGVYLFEPIVGANHSWQIGALLEGYKNWQYDCIKTGLYFYGTANHIFKSTQCRTFALKNNGPGSQYLLLKQFTPTATALEGLDRVANVLNGEVKIGAKVMIDAAVMLQASGKNLFVNAGYNFWLRSSEEIEGNVCFRGFRDKTFGIKGSQPCSEQAGSLCPPPGDIFCISNLTTASKSTLQKPADADPSKTIDGADVVVPRFLSCKDDIDFGAPLHPLALSHKIFGTIGYNFDVKSKYIHHWLTPIAPGNNEYTSRAYFLVSGQLELGHSNAALSQWVVVGKVGIEF